MGADILDRARRALDSAVDFVVRSQNADGSWEGTADPRIFDSAVAAFALGQGEPEDQLKVRQAREWLARAEVQRHHPVAAATEQWLRQLVLAPHSAGPPPLSLTGSHFRRALLVHSLAVSAKLPDADPPALFHAVVTAGQAVGDRPLKQWQRITLTAAEIIARHALGLPVPVRCVTGLTAEQRVDGSFCLMPAVTGLAYLALRDTDQGSAAAAGVRGWLLHTQCSDGTWRFVSNNVWDTALMVCSLRGCPAFDEQALQPAATFLEHAQSPDGGWSYKHGLESDPDSTGMTLLALAGTAEGRRVQQAARAFAVRTQLPDGCWPSWQSADDRAAPDVTANMVTGLAAQPAMGVDTSRAARWLVSLGRSPAGWRAEWYTPSSYAVREIAAAVGWAHPVSRQAAERLLAQQNDDGGWPTNPDGTSGPGNPSGLAATGLALSVLARTRTAVPSTALDYVIGHQRKDGSWPGTAIMYGPRPFLSHFPTHTHAFTVAGLRDLLNKTTPARVDRTPPAVSRPA